MLSKDLNYINADSFERLIENVREVERILKALIKSLEKK